MYYKERIRKGQENGIVGSINATTVVCREQS